jgi:hypothetical protein
MTHNKMVHPLTGRQEERKEMARNRLKKKKEIRGFSSINTQKMEKTVNEKEIIGHKLKTNGN